MSDVEVDFMQHTEGGFETSGSLAAVMANPNADYMSRRPFLSDDVRDPRSYTPVWNGKYDANGNREYTVQVSNAGAVLRKNEWEFLDRRLVEIAKPRLQLINSMRAAGLVVNFPEAYSHSLYQYERVSDIDGASVSMSPKTKGTNDRSTVDLVSVPLPIIHKEFYLEAREIAIARKTGQRLPVHLLDLAGRRVAETAEQMALGTWGTFSYGGATLHGLTNFPSRNTGAFLNPTVAGWTPDMLYNSVLQMIKVAQDDNQFGPYDLYYSTGMMVPMNRMFSQNYAGGSVIENLRRISLISNIQQLDYLSGNQLLLVQRDQMTASLLMGMDMRVVQWQTDGGESVHFRVMMMMTPIFRTDQLGQSGIVHFTGNNTTV